VDVAKSAGAKIRDSPHNFRSKLCASIPVYGLRQSSRSVSAAIS
jgi:hypothetical protein